MNTSRQNVDLQESTITVEAAQGGVSLRFDATLNMAQVLDRRSALAIAAGIVDKLSASGDVDLVLREIRSIVDALRGGAR